MIATLAARKPNGIAAWISVAVSTIGLSLPPFVISLVLVFVFAVKLKAVPPLGFVSMSTNLGWNLRTLILPAVSLALPIFAVFNRMLRADLLDQMQAEDYITTARAKGASPWRVLLRHALRNSLFGLLTVAGLQVGVLLGTTVVVEQIFSVPGVGQQLCPPSRTRTSRSSRASSPSSRPSPCWPTSSPTCSTPCSTQGSAMTVQAPEQPARPAAPRPPRCRCRAAAVPADATGCGGATSTCGSPVSSLAALLIGCFILPLTGAAAGPDGRRT